MRMFATESTGTGKRNTHSSFVSTVVGFTVSIFTVLDLFKDLRFMGGKIGSGRSGCVLYGDPSIQSGRV